MIELTIPKNQLSFNSKMEDVLSRFPPLCGLKLSAWNLKAEISWNGISLKLEEEKQGEEEPSPLTATAELDYPEELVEKLHDGAGQDNEEGSGREIFIDFIADMEDCGYTVREVFTEEADDFGVTSAWGTGLSVSIKNPSPEKIIRFIKALPAIQQDFENAYM